MIICDRQKHIFLLNNPHLLIDTLAFWAVSVAATIVADLEVTASITLVYVTTEFGCSASLNGRQCFDVMDRHLRSVHAGHVILDYLSYPILITSQLCVASNDQEQIRDDCLVI